MRVIGQKEFPPLYFKELWKLFSFIFIMIMIVIVIATIPIINCVKEIIYW